MMRTVRSPRIWALAGLLAVALLTTWEWPVLASAGWTQVNISGFGNPDNSSALAMQEFDGYLYVATESTNPASSSQVWKLQLETSRWRDVTPGWSASNGRPEAMAVFQDSLYVGTDHGELWRSVGEFRPCVPVVIRPGCLPLGRTPPLELWTKVHVPWLGGGVSSMAVIGDALFVAKVGATASQGWGGVEIWRLDEGGSWSLDVPNGFGDPVNNHSARLAVYRDQLYAGTAREVAGANSPHLLGLEIWRRIGPFAWEAVVATGEPGALIGSGFGEPGNGTVTDTAVFQDRLYVTTVSHLTCADVWRFDGSVWQDVTPSEYREALPCRGVRLQTLAVFDRRIFLGEGFRSDPAIFVSASGDRWASASFPGVGISIDAMVASRSHLYVALKNDMTGVQIWRRSHSLFEPFEPCLIRPELCRIR